jgi:tRNA-binding protein
VVETIPSSNAPNPLASFTDFQKLDIRVGRVVAVEPFPRARNPSYRLKIDFGPDIGIRESAAQATNYTVEQLLDLQVIGIVNLPPKNIAGFPSQALVLGVPSEVDPGKVSLLVPSRKAILGGKVY